MPIDLLLESPAVAAKNGPAPLNEKDLAQALKQAGIPIDEIHSTEHVGFAKKGKQMHASGTKQIVAKSGVSEAEILPWDLAHITLNASRKLGVSFAEPDAYQPFVVQPKMQDGPEKVSAKSFARSGENGHFDPDWPPNKNIIWHLDDAFSQLASARNAVADLDYPIRIAHLYTGYAASHPAIPQAVKKNPLQRNFVDSEPADDATDRMTNGLLKMPGHGTGTLGILAGDRVKLQTHSGHFHDYLGGAPFAEVICCRVAPTVVLMKTSAFADAVNYLVQLCASGTQVHVLSMSMGGAPSRAWANAVNAAYDAGITLVTAAGNHFNGLPTRHLVYPARFGRVIAACGVTYAGTPYLTTVLGEMQGCHGPLRHMKKALAAFTPNTPWASVTSGGISFAGAGTSSATPQIAAAAAIYYRKYHQQLDALQPWQRVEAIRYALYKAALKKVNLPGEDYRLYFGNGILKANDALSVPVNSQLQATPMDKVPWFPILTTLFKSKNPEANTRAQMFNTELAQLVYHHAELSALIDDEERPLEKLSAKKWKIFRDAVTAHLATSETLRSFFKSTR
jgi:subtilisin family serine protease